MKKGDISGNWVKNKMIAMNNNILGNHGRLPGLLAFPRHLLAALTTHPTRNLASGISWIPPAEADRARLLLFLISPLLWLCICRSRRADLFLCVLAFHCFLRRFCLLGQSSLGRFLGRCSLSCCLGWRSLTLSLDRGRGRRSARRRSRSRSRGRRWGCCRGRCRHGFW